jgi:hypothetical protein
MMNDNPVNRQLIHAHELHGGSVVAIRQIETHEVERHGIVLTEPSMGDTSGQPVRVTGLIEKPPEDRRPPTLEYSVDTFWSLPSGMPLSTPVPTFAERFTHRRLERIMQNSTLCGLISKASTMMRVTPWATSRRISR